MNIDNTKRALTLAMLLAFATGSYRTAGAEGGTSSFLDMLNEADAIVRGSYPKAEFYEAGLNIAMAGSPWQFVFNDPSTTPNSTVIIKNYLGQFQEPEHIASPWLEDRVIPVSLVNWELAGAEAMAKGLGWTGTIAAITLRWPLNPGANEPYYIFKIPSQGVYVFVGVWSRTVKAEPIGGIGLLDMLNDANAIVKKTYPTAQFYEANLDDVKAGTPWRFVFNDPSTTPNSTVIIKNYKDEFQKPEHVASPWLGDRVVPLPMTLGLQSAERLARLAGWTGEITSITLRWPLYPGVTEPSYIFGVPSRGVWVFVGVYTRLVTSQPMDQSALGLGGGARFWIYLSPMNDTARWVTRWDVCFQQSPWQKCLKSPETSLQTAGRSGIFELSVVASGPGFSNLPLKACSGSRADIGCNSNCSSMVQIVATPDGRSACYVTTWDAVCSGPGGH